MRKAFHGVRDGDWGFDVKGAVNDSITALTDQFNELQMAIVNQGPRGARKYPSSQG